MKTQIASATISDRIHRLRVITESLGDLKTSYNKGSQELWRHNSLRSAKMIAELRSEGVSEQTHPIFKNAMIKYNYWAFKG